MARPALSAARGMEIIDLFAAAPGRGMTLSEVARATAINVASCHAVLTVLVERGYLLRNVNAKVYSLGPVLFATGQAALRAQPLLAHAEAAARALSKGLAVPAMMSAAVGDEIVGIVSVGDPGTQPPLLRNGERRPRIPPLGAPFVAWSGEEAIERWLAKAPDARLRAELRQVADAIRERGFEVLLRPPEAPALAARLSEMAGAARPDAYHRLGPEMALPATIVPEQDYDVTMIAAPIFDRFGACAYNLCLGPFPQPLSGQEILDLADRLLATCVDVMNADRAQLSRR